MTKGTQGESTLTDKEQETPNKAVKTRMPNKKTGKGAQRPKKEGAQDKNTGEDDDKEDPRGEHALGQGARDTKKGWQNQNAKQQDRQGDAKAKVTMGSTRTETTPTSRPSLDQGTNKKHQAKVTRTGTNRTPIGGEEKTRHGPEGREEGQRVPPGPQLLRTHTPHYVPHDPSQGPPHRTNPPDPHTRPKAHKNPTILYTKTQINRRKSKGRA